MNTITKLACLFFITIVIGCTKDKSQQIREQSSETPKRVNAPGITFSPASALYGSAITINGSFSTTPGANVVKINGVTGIINSVAADKIVVTVPVTATTGKISVTAYSITTTSITDFKVLKLVKEGSKPTGFDVDRLSFDRSGNGVTYALGPLAVKKITANGTVTTLYKLPMLIYPEYQRLMDIDNDGMGNVYIIRNRYRDHFYIIEPGGWGQTDTYVESSVVLKINAAGQVSPLIGDGRGAKFHELRRLMIDVKGQNILLFHNALPNNQVATKVNQSGVAENINRPIQNYDFCPDENGNYYTMFNCDLKKVSIDGVITYISGSGEPGSKDGAPNVAKFYPLSTLAVDGNANVFVTDGRAVIRLVNTAGYVSTLPATILSSTNKMYFNHINNKLIIQYRTEIHQYGVK